MFANGTIRTNLGLLALRLGVGSMLMYGHGLGKLKSLFSEHPQFGDPIGLGTIPSLALITFAEFVGAILVILGLFTRLGALSVVIGFTVAVVAVHGHDPWFAQILRGSGGFPFSLSPAKEYALLYLVPFGVIFVTGAGSISFDCLIAKRSPKLGCILGQGAACATESKA